MEYGIIAVLAVLAVIILIYMLNISSLQNSLARMNITLRKISDKVGVAEDPIDSELRNLISQGKKIEAVKKCRVATGLGLKEAYDYVENLK